MSISVSKRVLFKMRGCIVYLLKARKCVRPASDVRGDILVDTFETSFPCDAVIAEVRIRREVEIVRVAR